ncbi:uncharacterized protein [Pagrus major]|uniref:uncharacterized protein n=1 Tax=Pagrus major TaxID=143350 RepID=UPI003CC8DD4E
MVEFRWIKMSLFLMLVLHFKAAVTGQPVSSVTVRVKDNATLPCNNVMDGQNNCDSTTWLFSGSSSTSVVVLVDLGRIDENAKAKSDRLSVTENCSLVIKNVTVEDVGRYDCQQYKSHIHQVPDSVVYLSAVSMTEHRDTDVVTLSCSVSTYGRCKHTVKWLYEGKEVDKDKEGVTTSQSSCSASVRVLTSHHIYESGFKFLKCSVTDGNKEQQLFPFRLQSSGKKPGEETTTTTTTTTKPRTTTKLTQIMEKNTKAGTISATNDASTKPIDWRWLLIILAVVLVALLIIVVKVLRKKRAEENKSQMEDNVGLTSNPAEAQSAPETSQGTADPEDGVHYASISYTKNAHSKAKVRGKNDYEDSGEVTYTTVKAPSTDPSCLYATVKK